MHKLTKEDVQAAIGIFLAIGLVRAVSSSLQADWLLAPFGATCVIAFLTYDSEFAVPKNIIGGYIVTSTIGVGVAFGLGHNWWTYALGVSLAMLVKRLFNVVHPPSAAMPIILISLDQDSLLEFILLSLLPGLVMLITVAVVYNHYLLRNGYPLWQYKKCS